MMGIGANVTDGTTVVEDISHLAPMMIVALWSLLHLLADAFAGPGMRAFQRRLAVVGVMFAVAAGLTQFGNWQYDAGVQVFSGFLVVDQFSILLDLGILLVCGGVILFSGDYARSHRFEYGEQEALILIAAFGMMVLAHAADLLAIFLGIETMSIAVYVLVGARWNSRRSPEAALKYFVMGAFSSGLLVMGIALLYGATGTTSLHELGIAISRVFTQWGAAQPYVELVLQPEGVPADVLTVARDKAVTGMAPAALFIPGVLLTLCALLFKVSAVPFHMWTPDAYDGAPTPTTAFMAAGVKIGGFAALLKVMVGVFYVNRLVTAPYGWTTIVAVIALLTMTVGNLAAVRQSNVKRLLAYSSIAHVGYLLVGVVAAASFYGHATTRGAFKAADQLIWSRETGDLAIASVLFYLLTYAVATLGTFACAAFFSANKKEATEVHQWAGMAQKHPGMAIGMTICLLSLMGMPPTAGFIGKLAVFRVALENDNVLMRVLVVAALLNSVIGAYYYLRLIVAMYFRPPPERDVEVLPSRGARTVVALAAFGSLALGLAADAAMRRCELGASGFIYPAGSDQRGQWVDHLRERWEVEAAKADAAALLEGDENAAVPVPPAGDDRADAEPEEDEKADAEADAKAEPAPG
jgi:NADH-quinone oxidoreductase subunit N